MAIARRTRTEIVNYFKKHTAKETANRFKVSTATVYSFYKRKYGRAGLKILYSFDK